MESLRELLAPKTVNKFSFTANVLWFVLGVVLSSVFLDMENNDPRFHCDAKDDQELIQGKCHEQYEKRYNELSIPVYAFVLFNFFIPMIACGIYSQYVKSRISELEEQQQPLQPRQGSPPRKLFKAYCFQLVARFLLGILCISLQITVFYPQTFPSNFTCDLEENDQPSENITQTQTYECHNQRATYKNFWTYAVIGVNGIFAFLVLMEIFYILTRVMKKRRLVEDFPFYAFHLRSLAIVQPEQQRHQQQSLFQAMKDNIIKETERLELRDLQLPFLPSPGEGNTLPKELKIDQIYTNLIIHCGRVNYNFSGDRREQLKAYPKPNKNSPSIQARNIIDAHHKNVLVVGRPGIGKSLFCIKLLRDWASDTETENSQLNFEAIFLLKFRRMNSVEKPLTLRELLAFSEYSPDLNEDAVWKYVLENPTKVLLIFDGVDEMKFKKNIAECSDSDQPNDVTAKMSVPALFNKIASGKLLGGATVLTITRPNAVSFVKPLKFDRTVEILGFTSEQVEDYVNKFTADEQEGTGRTIWQHISSNLNIFSLCYVPVNCFIICTCLLHVLQTLKRNVSTLLPTKLTDIYSIAIKMFYFKHSRNYEQYGEVTDLIREPFENLPDGVQAGFKRLGKIAFIGIEEGRLIFESEEVEELEDCGLLHRLPDLCDSADSPFEKRKAQFCFLHLTIQEFLAAKYVADNMNEEELREFVHYRITQGAWHVVLQFVAGLLRKREASLKRIFVDALPLSTETFNEWRERKAEFDDDEVFDLKVRSELIFWPPSMDRNLVVALSMCLYEIDVDDPILQTKLRKIGFNAADFSNCLIGPVECLGLVNLLNSHSVVSLELSHNNLGSLGCKQIQPLLAISDKKCNQAKLRRLNLHGNEIEDEGVRHLAEALTHSNCKLNSLHLSGNDSISGKGVKHLAEALTHGNCKLNSLHLSGNDSISGEGVKHLAEALTHSNCKLNSLHLSGNDSISGEGVKHLAEALTHSNCKLNSLHLSGNDSISGKGVKHLAEALTHGNCKLNSLHLSGNDSISSEGVKHLAKALTHDNCKLNILYLSHNIISNEGVERLAEALTHRNCKLNILNLSLNKIRNEGVKHLAGALTHSDCKLNSLTLNSFAFTIEGVKHLTDALTHSDCKLNSLNLSYSFIRNEGVKHLAEALTESNCKLNSLNLSSNFIGDEGVKHLAEALTHRNCKLNSLNLSSTFIRDKGVEYLAEALTHRNCKLNSLTVSAFINGGRCLRYLRGAAARSNCKLYIYNTFILSLAFKRQ